MKNALAVYETMRDYRRAMNGTEVPHIVIYDNEGETFDRYTVYIRTDEIEDYDMYTMSANAFSPDGFNQYAGVSSTALKDDYSPAKLGKRISFDSVPFDVALCIAHRLI